MTRPGRHEHLLPPAQVVALGHRGSTTVWDSHAWEARPSTRSIPVLLLHGWNIDAPANFGSTFHALSLDRRVVMFDQHGHGAGPRRRTRFSFEDAADDADAVLNHLGLDAAIVVGYSLGGAIAQTMARSRSHRVDGVVLAATADNFATRRRERAQFSAMASAARAMRSLPETAQRRLFERIAAAACRRYPPWILETVRAADPVTLLEAGASLGTFDSSSWLASIGVPGAVIVTEKDTVVAPHRQRSLIEGLRPTEVVRVDSDHDLPIRDDPQFTSALQTAIQALEDALIVPARASTIG